jgi:signal transduction histidine kinase
MAIFSSLTNRIFLASAALAILCISVAIYVVNVRVTNSAEDELKRALVQTGAVVDQQRATASDLFAVLARFANQMPTLKAAIDTGDPPTVRPIAADYQRQSGADFLLVTDRAGRVLANLARRGDPDPAFASLATVRQALQGREGAMFWVRPGGIVQVVSVPITGPPDILGSFSVGFVLDDDLALLMKKLTGSEIAFAAGSHVVASTLPPTERSALVPLIGQTGVSRIWVGSDEYLALPRPLVAPRRTSLFAGAGRTPTVPESQMQTESLPVAIILQSRTGRLKFLREIQTTLVATGVVAVLLAIGVGYAIARSIARPLAAITATMREMTATGDLTRKIDWQGGRWEDEDAALLARTFNSLTEAVTRFQREATERERLSALGRLSTVVAHEVRNPLMIIRASLRPLLRGSPAPAEIQEAAADINEEVTRLNRVVNEVLDYARPLRFDLAPTDVNRLCEESAEAASADHTGPPVHVEVDPSVGVVTTDAERLRSALVNILVNARHAVAARRANQPADPVAAGGGQGSTHPLSCAVEDQLEHDVVLSTEPLPGGRFAIVVRDRGIGIEPAAIARVFEPYFTTKRTGTGLGLAISRNIVQGLGGTIEVASEPGQGTEIRLELPVDALRKEHNS